MGLCTAIFHVVYDLDDRYQVPGQRFAYAGTTEKCRVARLDGDSWE